MVDLNDIAVFLAVADAGSFSRAARALGMPVSTVSRRLSELERALGVTLVQRTTRKSSLTSQGREYLGECRAPLEQLVTAERVLTRGQRRPEGPVRISVPVILGETAFLEFVSGFLRHYPDVRVDLTITNQFVDLVADNIDVAIRFGDLKSSSTVARRLGTSVRWVVAAPSYLAGRSQPKEPADLADERCVVLGGTNNEAEWELASERRRARVNVKGMIASRDFRSVSYFVGRGHGVGLVPTPYCEPEVRAKKLVRLLPKWTSPPVAVHAVYPSRRFLPERIHVFLEELKAWDGPFWSR